MKTLIITLEYPPQLGGIATYVYNLAEHLYHSDVVVYAPPHVKSAEFDKNNDWKTIRLKPYWFGWPRWLRLYFQVAKIVKTEKIEQLYIHHILPVGYIGWLIKKFHNIPYIIFLHGTDVSAGTQKIKITQFKFACKGASRLVVNSEFLKQKLLSRLPRLLVPITTINPSPSDIFFEQVSSLKILELKRDLGLSGRKVVLTVARLTDGKGYPNLLRAFARVLELVPTAVWLIIGEGYKRGAIIKEAEKLEIASSIRFVGSRSLNELPAFYQLADAFALLTHPDKKAEEGWGMAFLEAAASGLPVVAGKVGGVTEAVIHNQTGLVVDANNDVEGANAIFRLLIDLELAKRLGSAGQARAFKEFTWSEQLKKMNV